MRVRRKPEAECSRRVRIRYSPVAQSVEQVAVNHPVGGSNPSGGASATSCIKELRFVFNSIFVGRPYFCTEPENSGFHLTSTLL